MHGKAFCKILMVFRCLDNGWFLVFFFFYPYLQIQIFLKAIYDFCNMLYKICSIAQWCPTLCSPWTVGYQAPMSTEFSKQVYWSGLPFPPQGNLPNPGIEAASFVSPALEGRFFTTCAIWKAHVVQKVTHNEFLLRWTCREWGGYKCCTQWNPHHLWKLTLWRV